MTLCLEHLKLDKQATLLLRNVPMSITRPNVSSKPLHQATTMKNETLRASFPATQQDISNLKQTATDAVNDLGNTASVHASKARSQVKDLVGHFQDEGGEQVDQAKGKLLDVVYSARAYASERPFVCIGVALAAGFFVGLSRCGRAIR